MRFIFFIFYRYAYMLFNADKIRNFYRLPVHPTAAQFMWVWVKDDEEVWAITI